MQEKARAVLRPRPQTRVEVLRRYPRLVAHMICVSLGYFTPAAAAGALLDYIQGETHACEYYCHMAQGWDREKLLKVGRDVVGGGGPPPPPPPPPLPHSPPPPPL